MEESQRTRTEEVKSGMSGVVAVTAKKRGWADDRVADSDTDIMNEGRKQKYLTAVRWLAGARCILS